MNAYKPDGYNDLSAYLVADGAPQLTKFLEDSFGNYWAVSAQVPG